MFVKDWQDRRRHVPKVGTADHASLALLRGGLTQEIEAPRQLLHVFVLAPVERGLVELSDLDANIATDVEVRRMASMLANEIADQLLPGAHFRRVRGE